jgi:Tol biopolymer transport system component/predicted Ser/Thr protein kinase
MGEVWKARDTRLDRMVALKVSQEHFSERFEREAKAIAALNHTHICTLYDVGPNYLVMEYIEGTPLKGPLPVDQALKYAAQICDALDAAHKKGITHRDLKPANILVTKAGIKLLDFGLAKLGTPGTGQAPKPDDATLAMALTGKNEIVGTLYYMSPEQLQAQASGQEIDGRSDIFSFGLVLYEILTGKRAFEASSQASVIAAIMERPAPSIADVAPGTLDWALKRCLEKDPENRWQTARDLKAELERIASAPESGSAVPVATKKSRLGGMAWGVAALFALGFAALAFLHFRETQPPEQALRYTVAVPESSRIHSFAISPDGRSLVIAAMVNGKQQLWLRPMDGLEAHLMASTEEAMYPFWSPDSRYIGFFAGGKLKKIAAAGGPPQTLCDAPAGRGGTWGKDDVILFTASVGLLPVQRVSAAGGAPVDATKTSAAGRWPVYLPDGRHFLYVTVNNGGGIFVSSLDGNDNRLLLPDRSGVVFAPSTVKGSAGHILFVRENTLMALPFDVASAKAVGEAFPLVVGVGLTSNVNYLPVRVSDNGVLVYLAGGISRTNQIGWFDRSGKSLGAVGAPGLVVTPALSPDEKRVVYFRVLGATRDLWIRDLSRGTEVRFTDNGGNDLCPFWSPDGDRIVFMNIPKGVFNLFQKATSGSTQEELLLPSTVSDYPTQWSRDGRFIVYEESDPKNKFDLWVLPVQGTAAERKPMPFLRTEFNEIEGQLSPDSRWMAFASDRSGRYEVYVRPFPPGEGEWAISNAGGTQPRWRADGKEMFFIATDGKMMAVPVKAAPGVKPSLEAGVPAALFDAHDASDDEYFAYEYDVTADGSRFLIDTTGGGGAAPALTVVTHYDARMPSK